MDATLRVGIAVFNTGDHRVARDAWTASGHDDRVLSGLRRYADAIEHAHAREWTAARRLAAGEPFAGLDTDARVNVGDLGAFCRRLAADPEILDRRRPLPVRYDGDALVPTDLRFAEVATAARLLATAFDGFEASVVDDAVRYARDELADSSDTPPKRPRRRSRGFVTLLFDFAADRDRRRLVYDRLRRHVERRRSEESDVSGLFG